MNTMYNPASPGELLREFLGDRSIADLAEHIEVARATVSRILNGHTAVTVDLSIRLGEALSLSPDFFSKAQIQYDMWVQSQSKRRKIKPLARPMSPMHSLTQKAQDYRNSSRRHTVNRTRAAYGSKRVPTGRAAGTSPANLRHREG
jgi:antitoxin HigA-1